MRSFTTLLANFVSLLYGSCCKQAVQLIIVTCKIRQSISRKDDPYDNAYAELFWSRIKAEVLRGGAFLNIEDFCTEIFDFI